MPQTPAPTRANVRQSATWRISDTNLSPPCQLTTHAADSMLFLSKSRLFGFLPTKFPEYPLLSSLGGSACPMTRISFAYQRIVVLLCFSTSEPWVCMLSVNSKAALETRAVLPWRLITVTGPSFFFSNGSDSKMPWIRLYAANPGSARLGFSSFSQILFESWPSFGVGAASASALPRRALRPRPKACFSPGQPGSGVNMIFEWWSGFGAGDESAPALPIRALRPRPNFLPGQPASGVDRSEERR